MMKSTATNNLLSYPCTYPDQPPTAEEVAGEDECVQYVFDNIDHNMETLLGKGTFHGMASIVFRNGGKDYLRKVKGRIPRLTSDFINNISGVPILPYNYSEKRLLNNVILYPIDAMEEERSNIFFLTLLWHFELAPSVETPRRPNWSGFMEAARIWMEWIRSGL